MPLFTRVAGQYKRVYNVYQKVGGSWQRFESIHYKFSGKWKLTHFKVTVFQYSITISTTVYNFNLRNELIAAGWDTVSPVACTVTITATGKVLGSVANNYAFSTGITFPEGSALVLNNAGVIAGRGGDGGSGLSFTVIAGDSRSLGKPGSPALFIGIPTTLTNTGVIAGGGGGGGGGGTNDDGFGSQGLGTGGNGGGGAGGPSLGGVTILSPETPLAEPPGGAGSYPSPGSGTVPEATVNEGGYTVYGGTGANGAVVGSSGATGGKGYYLDANTGLPVYNGSIGGAGGAPGAAISGSSFITFLTTGTIIGAQA